MRRLVNEINEGEADAHARPLARCWWRWEQLIEDARAAGHRPEAVEAMIADALPTTCPLDRRDATAEATEQLVRNRLHLVGRA